MNLLPGLVTPTSAAGGSGVGDLAAAYTAQLVAAAAAAGRSAEGSAPTTHGSNGV